MRLRKANRGARWRHRVAELHRIRRHRWRMIRKALMRAYMQAWWDMVMYGTGGVVHEFEGLEYGKSPARMDPMPSATFRTVNVGQLLVHDL